MLYEIDDNIKNIIMNACYNAAKMDFQTKDGKIDDSLMVNYGKIKNIFFNGDISKEEQEKKPPQVQQ